MRSITVGQLSRYIGGKLDADERLRDLWIEGEASNCSRAASGHWYWTLKESEHQLACVMWRSQALLQQVQPQDGASLLCHGQIRSYPSRSQYQLVVDAVELAGAGVLHLEFERLKRQLAAEGLFDESLKRTLPALPARIGIVTSAEGSAFRDVRTTLARRWPVATLVLASVTVQGVGAAPDVADAIRRVSRANVDLVILARGGGSLEDLAAFNHEGVVRAIRAAPCPVITGVGHETDTTLADLAADVRAATPTAAAELCTPDIDTLRQRLDGLQRLADRSLDRRIARIADRLHLLQRALAAASPWSLLDRRAEALKATRARMDRSIETSLAARTHRVEALGLRLRSLGPDATFARGYAQVCRVPDGLTVTDADQVPSGTTLAIRVARGRFAATSDGPTADDRNIPFGPGALHPAGAS